MKSQTRKRNAPTNQELAGANAPINGTTADAPATAIAIEPVQTEAPPKAEVLGAPRARNSDRFWMAATFVLIVGIAARQLLLGSAPFHPDEAIHAFFAQGFVTYHYNPIYHGPLLYHLVAAVFGIFRAYDFTARLVPSLLGIGLLALVLFPMRRFVSNRVALASAGLLAISPSIVTYSRHLLHDSLALFLTMGAVLCLAWTLEPGQNAATSSGRWARLGVAGFLTLFLATKANCFFIAVMLLGFWWAWRLSGLIRLPAAVERWMPAFCFGVVTLGAIAFPRDNTFPEAIKIAQHRSFQILVAASCGALWLWLLSRPVDGAERDYKADWFASGDPLSWAHERLSETSFARRQADAAPYNAGAAWLTYFLAAALALWLYVFLFGQVAQIIAQWAQTGSFPAQTVAAGRQSAQGAIKQMWDYWAGQQAVPRLPGRHDYYIVLGLLYEIPIFVAALGGIWHASRHRSKFTDLLLWWALTSWALYAVANEKVPWLLVHICLPLALLGGVWLGHLRAPKAVWAVGMALALFFTGRTLSALIFERAGDHAEPIFYAQTPDAFRDVTERMLADTRGDTRAIWMDGERQWPSVWYFRPGAPNVGESGYALGGALDIGNARAAVAKFEDTATIAKMTAAGWHQETVEFLIWPRASWTALEPKRYWNWFWTRETLPPSERGLSQQKWKLSILGGHNVIRKPLDAPPGATAQPTQIGVGEWSNAKAVVGWPLSQ